MSTKYEIMQVKNMIKMAIGNWDTKYKNKNRANYVYWNDILSEMYNNNVTEIILEKDKVNESIKKIEADILNGMVVNKPINKEKASKNALIIDFNQKYYNLENTKSEIDRLFEIIMDKKKQICIAKAHTIILQLHELLKRKRNTKSLFLELATGNQEGTIYLIKTLECLLYTRQHNIKLPQSIKYAVSTNAENKPHYQFIDYLHIVEIKTTWSMISAYHVLMKMLELRADYIEYQNRNSEVDKIKNIFK